MRVALAAGCLALAAGCGPAIGAQEAGAPEPPLLAPGTPTAATIDLDGDPLVPFRILVPPDAVAVEIVITGAAADVNVAARHEAPIVDGEADADWRADAAEWNPTLRFSRWDAPPLAPGTWYVAATYQPTLPPRIGGRRASRIPFTIAWRPIPARHRGALTPGTPAAGTLDDGNGHAEFWTLAVPEGAPAVRLDLADTTGDLDLLVRRAGPPLDRATADHEGDALHGRESLVFDGKACPALAPGTWHVGVIDPFGGERPEPYTLHATLGTAPPAALLALPTLPSGDTPLDRAFAATVEVIAPHGTGSGTFVTPDGAVLTNHHVVVRDDGTLPAGDACVIAVTLDRREPPRELFRARIVHADRDRDLALLAVTAGLYGQPLPPGLRFPTVPVGDPDALAPGDPLFLLGYPDAGGTRSRVSITLTRGIVAGREGGPADARLKTDAEINSGNSGGAALDAAGGLVRVPPGWVAEIDRRLRPPQPTPGGAPR